MEKATVNGVKLEYEVKGSGEPVLLIPMGPIADSFRPFLTAEALAGSYQLIAYHQRGQGGSTRTPPPVSFAEPPGAHQAFLDNAHRNLAAAHAAA